MRTILTINTEEKRKLKKRKLHFPTSSFTVDVCVCLCCMVWVCAWLKPNRSEASNNNKKTTEEKPILRKEKKEEEQTTTGIENVKMRSTVDCQNKYR